MQRSCEPDQGRPLYIKTATKKKANEQACEVCGYGSVVSTLETWAWGMYVRLLRARRSVNKLSVLVIILFGVYLNDD